MRVIRGASGDSYVFPGVSDSSRAEMVRLQEAYDQTIARHGNLRNAIVSLATMLDIPGIAREGTQPEVVRTLLEAVGLLREAECRRLRESAHHPVKGIANGCQGQAKPARQGP